MRIPKSFAWNRDSSSALAFDTPERRGSLGILSRHSNPAGHVTMARKMNLGGEAPRIKAQ